MRILSWCLLKLNRSYKSGENFSGGLNVVINGRLHRIQLMCQNSSPVLSGSGDSSFLFPWWPWFSKQCCPYRSYWSSVRAKGSPGFVHFQKTKVYAQENYSSFLGRSTKTQVYIGYTFFFCHWPWGVIINHYFTWFSCEIVGSNGTKMEYRPSAYSYDMEDLKVKQFPHADYLSSKTTSTESASYYSILRNIWRHS